MLENDVLDLILSLKESWKENRCVGYMTCNDCYDKKRETCESFDLVYDYIMNKKKENNDN